jgi:ribosomal protein S8
MNKESLIPESEFCQNYKIEISFINSLQENGFIETTTIGDTRYIHESQLQEIEKIVRLHYDLDINLEGIETVINLLERIHEMQEEINRLRNNLRFYENQDF